MYLGKWEDDSEEGTSEDDGTSENDRMKGISIYELLHALGFHHDSQSSDAPSYEYHSDSRKEITINKNWLSLTRFDPFNLSIMLYPCEKKSYQGEGHPEISVWVLKTDSKQGKTELSKLDKVGLNLAYPPHIVDMTGDNVRYKPKLSKNGMYYCGRTIMKGLFYPYPNSNFTQGAICGPDNGPNCPACRTINSSKVQMILGGGRWQGMTGMI